MNKLNEMNKMENKLTLEEKFMIGGLVVITAISIVWLVQLFHYNPLI